MMTEEELEKWMNARMLWELQQMFLVGAKEDKASEDQGRWAGECRCTNPVHGGKLWRCNTEDCLLTIG
jgi:hypothetical protein